MRHKTFLRYAIKSFSSWLEAGISFLSHKRDLPLLGLTGLLMLCGLLLCVSCDRILLL